MDLLSGGMMVASRGAVPTLRDVARVAHGTTLVGAAVRVSLGWIIGCVGMMTSQK